MSGQTGDPTVVRRMIEQQPPDILTLCLKLGSVDGIELIRQLKVIAPGLRILVLSALDEETWATRALAAGADGFLEKTTEPSEVIRGLEAVSRGETWLSPRMTSRILRRACGKEKTSEGAGTLDILSNRELHVFRLIGTGLGTRQIAGALHLSVKTVETYRANIRLKLGLRDSTETVARARVWVEQGEIAPSESGKLGEEPGKGHAPPPHRPPPEDTA